MDLASEISRYIKHKLVLANYSNHYLNLNILHSLQEADMLLKLFCRQKQYLTTHDIARFILQNKNNLLNILPSSANKSYESSYKKINNILQHAEQTLKPR